MEVCDTRHEPKFQVEYIPTTGSTRIHTWLVCDMCMNKKCFGDKDNILSVEVMV